MEIELLIQQIENLESEVYQTEEMINRLKRQHLDTPYALASQIKQGGIDNRLSSLSNFIADTRDEILSLKAQAYPYLLQHYKNTNPEKSQNTVVID